MACIITYENKQYTQKEFEQYFKEHFTEFVNNFLGSKTDIEGFKKFVEQPIVVDNNKKIKNKSDQSTLFSLWKQFGGELMNKFPSITEKDFNKLSEKEKNNLINCL